MKKRGQRKEQVPSVGRIQFAPLGSAKELEVPVGGIFGLTSATKSTVASVGPIGKQGNLPSHSPYHLVQIQDAAMGGTHTCQGVQELPVNLKSQEVSGP